MTHQQIYNLLIYNLLIYNFLIYNLLGGCPPTNLQFFNLQFFNLQFVTNLQFVRWGRPWSVAHKLRWHNDFGCIQDLMF
jgi:hypothetical protein